MKESLMAVASKSSRLLAMIFGFALVFGMLYLFDLSTRGITDFSADIMATPVGTPHLLQESLEQNYITILAGMFEGVPGAETFLADAESWEHVADVRLQEIADGIYVTILAAGMGDTLHPYFGYFVKENGKVAKIIWSGIVSAQLESSLDAPEGNYRMLTVTNSSDVPWLVDDGWTDEISGNEVVLLAADGGDVVLPKTSGTFVVQSDNVRIVPKNATRGYLVQIDEN